MDNMPTLHDIIRARPNVYRYLKPTPLYEEIRMEGHHIGSEGRKVFAEGRMWHGETLLAESSGIFIKIAGDFREEMLGRGAAEGRLLRSDEST